MTMKRNLGKLGTVAIYVLAAPLMLLLIVALLPLIFGGMAMNAYLKILAWLRHDPRHEAPKHYRIYTDNEYPTSERDVRHIFDKYLSLIKNEIPASLEVTEVDVDSDNKKILATPEDIAMITIRTSIRGEHGVATIEMSAVGGPGDAKIFSSSTNGDFPPYLHVIYTQDDGIRTVFDVQGSDALEFLVASLMNGQTISRSGQVWVRIEPGLYVVNYTILKSIKSDRLRNEYGYRSDLSHAKARMYLFDKKS